jgi:hypothetical protein
MRIPFHPAVLARGTPLSRCPHRPALRREAEWTTRVVLHAWLVPRAAVCVAHASPVDGGLGARGGHATAGVGGGCDGV